MKILFLSIKNQTAAVEEIHYNLMSADWPVYNDVKELTNAGNVIVLGKLTDISFGNT